MKWRRKHGKMGAICVLPSRLLPPNHSLIRVFFAEMLYFLRFGKLIIQSNYNNYEGEVYGESEATDEPRDKWLRLNPPVPRDTHPAFYRSRFVCKRIEQITRSDHGTYLVLVQRDTEEVEYVTLDCTTLLDIVVDADEPGRVSFLYERYFTERQRAALRADYLRCEYDDLGNVTEY